MSLMFFCNSCANNKEYSEFSLLVIEKWGYGIKRYCKECRTPRAVVSDTFWDGKPEINLADDPLTGKPRVFLSKGQKARYLQERGLQEAGDRVHGAPMTFHDKKPPRLDAKEEVQKALHQVRQMGSDRRHQEFLRITKEGRERA